MNTERQDFCTAVQVNVNVPVPAPLQGNGSVGLTFPCPPSRLHHDSQITVLLWSVVSLFY